MADWPQKHEGPCACRFVRREEYGEAEQVEWCGFHDTQRKKINEMERRLAEAQALVDALELCRFALEPYDDVKPRDWKTDRERLRVAHEVACAALAKAAPKPEGK